MVDRVAGGSDTARPAVARAEPVATRKPTGSLREAVAAENRAALVPAGLLEQREEGQPGSLYDRSL